MRKFYQIVIALLSIVHVTFAQNENNVWLFGQGVGLDFNTGNPLPVTGSLYSSEASTAVSDANGQLRFYTNGANVWTRTNTLMPNGQLTNADVSSTTQGALIAPVIGNPNEYYVFTLVATEGWQQNPALDGRLYYSVVNMQANGGLGDIDPLRKMVPIDFDLTEKMIAIPGDNCNLWILVHSRDTAMFKAYQITAGGISGPVVSYVGSKGRTPVPLNASVNSFYTVGELKVSPDRKKLAACFLAGNMLEMYDFNPATGVVSNPVLLDSLTISSQPGYYGTCFSGDGSKLYAIRIQKGYLHQFDLSSGIPATIRNSKLLLDSVGSPTQIQRGPDNKLYFLGSRLTKDSIGAINFPNLQGAACQVVRNAVVFSTPPRAAAIGIHNLYVKPLPPDTLHEQVLDTFICDAGEQIKLRARKGFSAYQWDNATTDTVRAVIGVGKYWVVNKDACHSRVDSFIVRFVEPDTVYNNKDTFFCKDESVTLTASGNNVIWNDGAIDVQRSVNTEGIYWYGRPVGECKYGIDSFTVSVKDISFTLGSDTILCDATPVVLHISVPEAAYLWRDSSTANSYTIKETGTYWATATLSGCTASDTVAVTYILLDQQIDLGADSIICRGVPFNIILNAHLPQGATALWSNGTSAPTIMVQDTGLYSVTVSQQICSASDTIHIGSVLCDCFLEMPSAFTPNGDGRNDIFRPVLQNGCAVQSFAISIYTRWGELIYSSADATAGWDGSYKGKPAAIDTYMYIFTFKGGTQGQEYTQKGDVTLIR